MLTVVTLISKAAHEGVVKEGASSTRMPKLSSRGAAGGPERGSAEVAAVWLPLRFLTWQHQP